VSFDKVKITEVQGLQIWYDGRGKIFTLENAQGDVLGSGKTQDEVEEQAKVYAKAAYHFPINAFESYGMNVKPVKLTSVNIKGKALWLVRENGERTKHSFSYGGDSIFEITPHNQEIVTKVHALRDKIDLLEQEAREAIKDLEKPINKEYFGLQAERWG
jgi:hypothetical protein